MALDVTRFLDLEGLAYYDEKIKGYIGTTEATTLQSAKDYTDSKIGNLGEGVETVADAITAHKNAIDSKVATLIGDDVNKSVRTIANEELAKQLIPENAKESLDTLSEIAAWIQNHPDDASAMNRDIRDLQAQVGKEAYTNDEGEDIPASGLVKDIRDLQEAVGGDNGSVSTQIKNAVEALDAEIDQTFEADKKGLKLHIKEVDGIITEFSGEIDSVTHSDIDALFTAQVEEEDENAGEVEDPEVQE